MTKREAKVAENNARRAGRVDAMAGRGLYYSGSFAWAYMEAAREVAERRAYLKKKLAYLDEVSE